MSLLFDFRCEEKAISMKQSNDLNIDLEKLLLVEKKKPNKMLDEYFMTFELDTCKQLLWIFLRETMTGEFPENTTRMDRDRIFHFYEYTVRLLEVMHKKYKKRSKKRHK